MRGKSFSDNLISNDSRILRDQGKGAKVRVQVICGGNRRKYSREAELVSEEGGRITGNKAGQRVLRPHISTDRHLNNQHVSCTEKSVCQSRVGQQKEKSKNV